MVAMEDASPLLPGEKTVITPVEKSASSSSRLDT